MRQQDSLIPCLISHDNEIVQGLVLFLPSRILKYINLLSEPNFSLSLFLFFLFCKKNRNKIYLQVCIILKNLYGRYNQYDYASL